MNAELTAGAMRRDWFGSVPGVDAPDALVPQDGEEGVEAGSVLAGLRPLAAQLHPVLHQVQRLHEHRGAHPAKETGTEAGGQAGY